MKALPSIAFNEFKGSAGDVTARVSKGRQVLSGRAMHSRIKTPAQAVSRNRLSAISRSYKKLEDVQMAAWASLAEKLKGISTFGSAAEMTAHNAFVRINSNRIMAGMTMLTDAPVYTNDVPEVEYDDLWISGANLYSRLNFWIVKCGGTAVATPPTRVGVDAPGEADVDYGAESFSFQLTEMPASTENLKLVIMASAPQSNGVTKAYSKAVQIGDPRDIVETMIDIKAEYEATHGVPNASSPKVFMKYFFVNTVTGEKSGEILVQATYSA